MHCQNCHVYLSENVDSSRNYWLVPWTRFQQSGLQSLVLRLRRRSHRRMRALPSVGLGMQCWGNLHLKGTVPVPVCACMSRSQCLGILETRFCLEGALKCLRFQSLSLKKKKQKNKSKLKRNRNFLRNSLICTSENPETRFLPPWVLWSSMGPQADRCYYYKWISGSLGWKGKHLSICQAWELSCICSLLCNLHSLVLDISLDSLNKQWGRWCRGCSSRGVDDETGGS